MLKALWIFHKKHIKELTGNEVIILLNNIFNVFMFYFGMFLFSMVLFIVLGTMEIGGVLPLFFLLGSTFMFLICFLSGVTFLKTEREKTWKKIHEERNRKNRERERLYRERMERLQRDWEDQQERMRRQYYDRKNYSQSNKPLENKKSSILIEKMKILGISKDELNEKSIKKKFKDLTKIWHPDLQNGDESKMKEIIEAKDYLLKNLS